MLRINFVNARLACPISFCDDLFFSIDFTLAAFEVLVGSDLTGRVSVLCVCYLVIS